MFVFVFRFLTIRSTQQNRLAEKFEFGGGKALPDEMTGPVMPIPSEARWKASEAKRVAAVVRRRKGLPDDNHDDFAEPGGGGGGGEERGCAPATTMFDQVFMFHIGVFLPF